MAFVVEDGTAKLDSNAYCDLAFVDAYFGDSGGNAAWSAAGDVAKQAAIVRATRYIDQRFGRQFLSQRTRRDQALQWPRQWIDDADGNLRFDTNDIPLELQRACAEYAARALVGALVSDPTESQEVEEKSVTIGPLKETTRFSSRSASKSTVLGNPATLRDYPTADLWMETLLRSGNDLQLARV